MDRKRLETDKDKPILFSEQLAVAWEWFWRRGLPTPFAYLGYVLLRFWYKVCYVARKRTTIAGAWDGAETVDRNWMRRSRERAQTTKRVDWEIGAWLLRLGGRREMVAH